LASQTTWLRSPRRGLPVAKSEEYVCKGVIADIEGEPQEGLQDGLSLAEPEGLGREELKAQFVALRAKGLSYRKIAGLLKVSKSTLANWSQEMEAEIASLKAIEIEGLLEEFGLLKEGRIRLLGGLIKRITEELLSRDLAKVSADRLLELLLKYQEALQAEQVEPRPLSSRQIEGLKAKGSTRLDSQAIAGALEQTLQRYKAGLLSLEQARQEMALLLAALKAEEQTVLAVKLERIEAVIGQRR
jgi:hypothetical protein